MGDVIQAAERFGRIRCVRCGRPIAYRSTYHVVQMPDGRKAGVHPYCMAAPTPTPPRCG